jgi:hypothetical protein
MDYSNIRGGEEAEAESMPPERTRLGRDETNTEDVVSQRQQIFNKVGAA